MISIGNLSNDKNIFVSSEFDRHGVLHVNNDRNSDE